MGIQKTQQQQEIIDRLIDNLNNQNDWIKAVIDSWPFTGATKKQAIDDLCISINTIQEAKTILKETNKG